MVSPRKIVFLTGILGTLAYCNALVPSLGTEIVMAKHKKDAANLIDNVLHTAKGLSPFISKFIQKGTNLFFKPQFTLSAAHISPPIQTMIVNDEPPIFPAPLLPPPIIMDEPIAPVIIPETPLVPFTLPVPPAPVVIDCDEKVFDSNPLPIIPIPMPPTSMVIEEPPAPLVIPEAPILPPLSLPALPLPVLNDCEENVVVSNPPELPVIPMVPPPIMIPEPPVPIVIPEAPLLPPLYLPNLPVPVLVEEHIECDDKVVKEPVVIPIAPVPLPPIHVPTLPLIHHTLTPHIGIVREKIERIDRIVIPHLPVLDSTISFPAECVQNIVTERVLPNILRHHNIGVVPTVPSVPVPSPYLPSLIKMF